MNVGSAAAAATSTTSDVSSTQSTSKSSSSSKTNDASFEEEMKSASKTEESDNTKETSKSEKSEKSDKSEKTTKDDKTSKDTKTSKDNQNNNSNLTDENDSLIPQEALNGEINFTDYKYHNESQSILTQNIQNLLNTKDLMNTVATAQTIDYDVINMSDSDANFFANLVQNTDMSMQSIANQISDMPQSRNVQKNVQVSSVLMEKLSDSMKTNQPFRINFDKDVSVIIKVNKDGSLSANFIPADKAVEQYLRNNISTLRQRFDEQELPYSELSYSNSREQRRQKKENNNER